MKKSVVCCLTFAAAGTAMASETTCNPLVLEDYPVGLWCRGVPNGSEPKAPLWRVAKTEQYRELADPTLLVENGEYWLYASGGEAWRSKDAAVWERVCVPSWKIGYAPTVVKHRGKFYAMGSDTPVYVADRPEGPWREMGRIRLPSASGGTPLPPVADPMLFSDDDGRLYFYFGCTPKGGIWGVELDPETILDCISEARELVPADVAKYPWMRCHLDEDDGIAWMEGAWMVKIGKKYALTYSASGTENVTYAMGAAYSDSPLGPFVVDEANPFLKKTEGVVRGTGHGSIVKGLDGKWRVVYCVAVGERHGFDRLVGMDILNMDEATGRILKTEPTETPRDVATGVPTGWKKLGVRNEELGVGGTLPEKLLTANYSLLTASTLRAVRIIWRDGGLDDTAGALPGAYKYRIEAKVAGEWRTVVDASDNTADLFVDYRETPRTEGVEEVRLVTLAAPKGITPSIYDFTAFGE